MKIGPHASTPDPTTRLGDWYANLIHVGRQQLVLAVSEKTLLPVVVVAAPSTTLVPRLAATVVDVLRALAVPEAAIEYEAAAMHEVVLGRTASKQVLGIVVDFGQLLPFFLDDGRPLLHVSLKLAHTPCSPLRKAAGSPDRETVALLGANTLAHLH